MEVRAIQKDRELEIKREGESKERYRVREIKGGSGMSKGRERKSIIKRERDWEEESERGSVFSHVCHSEGVDIVIGGSANFVSK